MRHHHRLALRIATIMLVVAIGVGGYATPMVLAHALGAPSVRIIVSFDDHHREPATDYFLSVTAWGVSVRVEWLAASTAREVCTRL